MYITNITEAKAHFSALIEKVLAGEEIIIGKSGKPVAKLVRFERREEFRQPGALKGKIKMADKLLLTRFMILIHSRIRFRKRNGISLTLARLRGVLNEEYIRNKSDLSGEGMWW